MGRKQSTAWKDLERLIAKKAAEYGLTGKRVKRGSDFSKKDVDAKVKEAIFLKFDAKRHQRFAFHTLLRDVKKKYCKSERHVEVLVTKTPNQKGAYVTIPIDFFFWLLAERFAPAEKRKKRWYSRAKRGK